MELPGIDASGFTDWFVQQGVEVEPPLEFNPIAGGHSNLTYEVRDRNRRGWALRRPPLGRPVATAHDVVREARIQVAMRGTPVAVADVLGICEDASVIGAPFYVMEFVDGTVIRTRSIAENFSVSQRAKVSSSVIEMLAAIHALDLQSVGLAELSHHDGYVDRQLKRWYGQFKKTQQRDIPGIETAYEILAADVPQQRRTTLVHGDYRLDNCMISQEGGVAAVLDWEICTLGDPLADLGLLMVYWTRPGDRVRVGLSGATTLAGFFEREEMCRTYESLTGSDLSSLTYYTAFGYWKLACILEGVYARYRAGAMATHNDSERGEAFGRQVLKLADASLLFLK